MHLSRVRIHSFDQVLKSLRAASSRERSVVKAFVLKGRIYESSLSWAERRWDVQVKISVPEGGQR